LLTFQVEKTRAKKLEGSNNTENPLSKIHKMRNPNTIAKYHYNRKRTRSHTTENRKGKNEFRTNGRKKRKTEKVKVQN
jgi:hypothetical protein